MKFLCVAAISDRGPAERDNVKSNRRISFNEAGHAHFLTFSCYRRSQILADDDACNLLSGMLNSARKRHDFSLWAYVFMPDHVHLLIRPRRESYSISRIPQAIKGPFARRYIDEWKRVYPERVKRLKVPSRSEPKYRVWERGGGYDKNLITPESIRQAIEYIEFNPVRAGFVMNAEEWRWSSAQARSGISDVSISIDEVKWELVSGK